MDEEPAQISVSDLLERIKREGFSVIAGISGGDRLITGRTIQRLGVALTGYTEHLDHGRLQMLGRSESGYLSSRPPYARRQLLETLVSVGFPGLVVTAGQRPSQELCDLCDEHHCVLIVTSAESITATAQLNGILNRRLAPQESYHGVLVDVYGVGILLTGRSGIGKSELGLELVAAGHRLVADDVVMLHQESPSAVVGSSPDLIRHHMEIRGLGILNIKDLFGASAIRDRKLVELVVELIEYHPGRDAPNRLGLDTSYIELLDVPIEHIQLPVGAGRSLRLVIEVAARNRLLQLQGTDSARAFADQIDGHLTTVGCPSRAPSGFGPESNYE